MKLGILADIHEATGQLREAIDRLRDAGAERLVLLGDVFENGRALDETIAILEGAHVTGVFGNHELGMCIDPCPELRHRYAGPVLDYFGTLRGRHEEGDCLFTHAQAWMDPADIEQPWYLHGPPDTPEVLARNFAATDKRVLFQGHYHRWLAATPEGVLPWRGEGPLVLEPGRRYLVVVHAVLDGWCACYDTATGELLPVRLTAPGR